MPSQKTTVFKKINHPLLFAIVFFCCAAVMIIELVGSRVIAPYVGTSVYVWTSLIGIILGSLSLGYFWGGRIADINASVKGLAGILFLSGISTTGIVYFRYAAYTTGILGSELSIASILFAPLLFVPATFFFGMITPYVTRLRLENLETSGSAVGGLYALSTIGSIVGTFLGGFFLISYFGNTNILLFLGIATIILSLLVWLLQKRSSVFPSVTILGIFLSLMAFQIPRALPVSGNLIADLDTKYKRVWVYDGKDAKTGRSTRILTDTVFGIQSGIFLDDPSELLFGYQKYFDLGFHFKPEAKHALMIGAGAFTYPPHYLKEKPENTMDVVEIDPTLKEIAKKYFSFSENSHLSTIDEDGRIFLNDTEKTYDSIFIDAFTSLLSIPYQLTTKEAVETVYNKLEDDGVVIVNIISGIEGYRGEFLRAEYATYKSVFPTVLLFKVHGEKSDSLIQNLILVAFKKGDPELTSRDKNIQALLKNLYQKPIAEDMPILRDDFAPVEKYTAKLML